MEEESSTFSKCIAVVDAYPRIWFGLLIIAVMYLIYNYFFSAPVRKPRTKKHKSSESDDEAVDSLIDSINAKQK